MKNPLIKIRHNKNFKNILKELRKNFKFDYAFCDYNNFVSIKFKNKLLYDFKLFIDYERKVVWFQDLSKGEKIREYNAEDNLILYFNEKTVYQELFHFINNTILYKFIKDNKELLLIKKCKNEKKYIENKYKIKYLKQILKNNKYFKFNFRSYNGYLYIYGFETYLNKKSFIKEWGKILKLIKKYQIILEIEKFSRRELELYFYYEKNKKYL